MASDLEARIRDRAYRIWLQDGCPEGKADAHWDLAKMAIAFEDAQPHMQKPIEAPAAEPVDAWLNQGEFPTLTDQGEQHVPGHPDDSDS